MMSHNCKCIFMYVYCNKKPKIPIDDREKKSPMWLKKYDKSECRKSQKQLRIQLHWMLKCNLSINNNRRRVALEGDARALRMAS